MMVANRIRPGYRLVVAAAGMVTLLTLWASGSSGETGRPRQSPEETERLGERLYRQGILPSGEPVQSFVKGDLPVPGTAFSCESCHLRSGLGSVEGGVVTPATTGRILYQPLQPSYKGYKLSDKIYPLPLRRPAYTDETLAEAIRTGIDPAGRELNDVMPRYEMNGDDMTLLIGYLKGLSSQFSPGVGDNVIRFATIVTDDVPPAEANEMLVALETYVRNKNNQAKMFENPRYAKSLRMAEGMMPSKELALRRLELSRWTLKGPAASWRGQLEEYYGKEPVFAILGGITKGDWSPVHQFCEDHRIPCLFPNTDFPVVSGDAWYTLYLSKGYYQEGEAAARYLNSLRSRLEGATIVQVVRESREGAALSRGFLETWRELGNAPPRTVTLKQGDPLPHPLTTSPGTRTVVVFWDGPDGLPGLASLTAGENPPEMVVASAGFLDKGIWSLKEEQRPLIYLTYPRRLFGKGRTQSAGMMGKINFSATTSKAANQTYAIIQVLTMALMEMRGNYHRDNFLDVIGMMPDQEVPLFERLSFGPGQRYASKGCYIVQLSGGSAPELIQKSDWVIH